VEAAKCDPYVFENFISTPQVCFHHTSPVKGIFTDLLTGRKLPEYGEKFQRESCEDHKQGYVDDYSLC